MTGFFYVWPSSSLEIQLQWNPPAMRANTTLSLWLGNKKQLLGIIFLGLFFCWKIFPGWSHTFDILLLLLATFVPSPAVCHAPQQVLQCQLVLRCPYGASQNIKSINPIFSSCLVKHGQGSQWRLQNCLTVNKHQQDSKVPSFIYTPLRISPKKQVSPIVFFENPGFISSFYC